MRSYVVRLSFERSLLKQITSKTFIAIHVEAMRKSMLVVSLTTAYESVVDLCENLNQKLWQFVDQRYNLKVSSTCSSRPGERHCCVLVWLSQLQSIEINLRNEIRTNFNSKNKSFVVKCKFINSLMLKHKILHGKKNRTFSNQQTLTITGRFFSV